MVSTDWLRSSLRDAVLRIEQLQQGDPDGAAESWRPVAGTELTPLDHFEHGGKRYVVAVEHPARAPEQGLGALSPRERQIVTAAAAGQTNKVIAYELGLAHSTVRVLLARAAKRIGAKSRQDLVAFYRDHQQPLTETR